MRKVFNLFLIILVIGTSFYLVKGRSEQPQQNIESQTIEEETTEKEVFKYQLSIQ